MKKVAPCIIEIFLFLIKLMMETKSVVVFKFRMLEKIYIWHTKLQNIANFEGFFEI